MVTAFDRSQFRGSLALGVGLLALALVIGAGTDEAGSTWARRGARLIALSPLVTGIAAALVLQAARSRGEVRALLALGAAPERVAYGALAAAWLLGVAGLVMLRWCDVSSLFPVLASSEAWRAEGGALHAPDGSVAAYADGTLRLLGEARSVGALRPGAGAAAWLVAPLAVIAPVWCVVPQGALLRAVSGLAAALSGVTVLHAVAAGRVAAPLGVSAAAPLVLALWWASARFRPHAG